MASAELADSAPFDVAATGFTVCKLFEAGAKMQVRWVAVWQGLTDLDIVECSRVLETIAKG